MQTFLPYSDFTKSAKVLDNKRLGKQRVEVKQILEINLTVKNTNPSIFVFPPPHLPQIGLIEKDRDQIPWENHPAVRMWRGYEECLALYGWTMCKEWISRGCKDTLQPFFLDKIVNVLWSMPEPHIDINYYPDWFKDSEQIHKFCLSHRSNLMRKNPNHYIKYFPYTPNNLPYEWNREYWK